MLAVLVNAVVDADFALDVDSAAATKASNAVVEDFAEVQRHVRNNTMIKQWGSNC